MSDASLLEEETDFDAAFKTASEQVRGTPKPKKSPDPQQGSEASAAAEKAEEPSTPAQPAPEAPKAEDDLQTQLQAALRERDEALHKWKSDANRQSHLMRENNQLKEQVARLTAEVEKLKKSPSEPTPAPKQEGELNDVLESAPELKAAVERRIQSALEEATRGLREQLDAAQAQLAEVGQTASQAAQRVEPLASREEQRYIEDVRAQLDKVFPTWRQDVASGALQRWLTGQPETVKAMFPGKGYDDSSTVLRLFYADKSATNPAPQGQPNKLKNAAGIAPRTVTRPVTNPDDFDGAFAEFAQKRKP